MKTLFALAFALFAVAGIAQQSADKMTWQCLALGQATTNANTSTAVFTNRANFGRAVAVLCATNVTGIGSMTATMLTSPDKSTWSETTYTMTVTTNWQVPSTVGFAITDQPLYLMFTNRLAGTTNSFIGSVYIVSPKQYRP